MRMPRQSAFCGLLALCGTALSAAPAVVVYMDFGATPSPVVVAAMQKEAAAVLDKVAIKLEWRLLLENRGDEPFDRLAVVKFTGTCACGGFLHPSQEVLVLGSTMVASGQVLPYSEVHCDQVRRLLPALEFASDRRQGDADLGRALGRVLAHELYHMLTRNHPPRRFRRRQASAEHRGSAIQRVFFRPIRLGSGSANTREVGRSRRQGKAAGALRSAEAERV